MASGQTATATATVTFAALWANYPTDDPCVNPATHTKAYEDQCSIKLGAALHKSGVDFKSFRGPSCEYAPPGSGEVLRAQELADWLMHRPFKGCPPAIVITPGKDFAKKIQNQTGIIFFQHYWLRDGEKANANRSAPSGTGNHIDLWNRDKLTPSFHNFTRFSLGIDHFPSLNPFAPAGQNWYSDLNKSSRVLFWQIA
jgi:hypothetical protein